MIKTIKWVISALVLTFAGLVAYTLYESQQLREAEQSSVVQSWMFELDKNYWVSLSCFRFTSL